MRSLSEDNMNERVPDAGRVAASPASNVSGDVAKAKATGLALASVGGFVPVAYVARRVLQRIHAGAESVDLVLDGGEDGRAADDTHQRNR